MTMRALALVLALLPAAAAAQGQRAALPPAPRDTLPTGILAGTVKDEAGRAIAEAIITVEGTARQVRSDTTGRFLIERVPVGLREVSIRRLGYRPVRAQFDIRADSAMVLSATLVAEATQIAGVRVEEQLLNQLGGVVLDERLEPLMGAEVDVVGLRRSVRTDVDGRFIFVDIPPGNYMLEVRAPGYALARRGVQMANRLERDLAIAMRLAGDERYTMELARTVAAEADRRKSLAGARATYVGRQELERFQDTPLLQALIEGSGAIAMREVAAGRGGRTRGPISIDGRGTSSQRVFTRSAGQAAEGLACVLVDGWEVPSVPILQFLRASEVELVEIFPAGSENSRTLCGRFPPSSGCSCPPEPAGIVVWLKK